jgi:hypothetical protein
MSQNIQIGNIYQTDTDQLRQIVGIKTDENGIVRISYNSKSAKIKNRDFELGHTKAMPPSNEKFKEDSGRLLKDDEIQDLIKTNIIKNSELI